MADGGRSGFAEPSGDPHARQQQTKGTVMLELLIGGFLLLGGGTVASSRKIANGGGEGRKRSSPPPYAPEPQYVPQDYGGYDPQESYGNPQNEVRIQADHRGHFYTDVEYDGYVMRMMVDGGCTHCAVSDEAFRYFSPARTSSGQSSLADGRIIDEQRFAFPYLRVGRVVVENVTASYAPGATEGLLGASFLSHCDVRISGGVMTIRG
jgi:clan AA aspartic protease (TIGR02281 family)